MSSEFWARATIKSNQETDAITAVDSKIRFFSLNNLISNDLREY